MAKNKREHKSKNTHAVLPDMLVEAEEAKIKIIEEKEKTFLAIINSFTDGLIILDDDGKIVKINPQIKNTFALKAQEIEGKDIAELKDNPLFSKVTDLILDGKTVRELKRKQFSPKENMTIELTSVPIINKQEKKGYLLIFHDISRQKLVEKLETEFVTLAAHQLRTPLSGIKWNLRMLIDGSFGELTEEQKKFLQIAYKSNDRMIKLVSDLLDATKIEEGRYLYYVKQEDILKIVEEVIDSLEQKIKQKNIKFEFIKPQRKTLKLNFDREKIAICIQNLLVNAITYTNPGGAVTISVKYDKDKKEVILSVQDNGIGIPKDHQKRIFTKFYRSTQAMKIETVGSGLGLYMTKNIIEAHKGKVWFESEEGKGSTFYFTLPIKD